MAKHLTLANGSMLVGIDGHGHVRDLYYPYVGLKNHISSAGGSFTHRVGVWAGGTCAWLDDPSWRVEVRSPTGTMGGTTHAVNETLGVSLTLVDTVDHEKNIFIRQVTVKNSATKTQTIKLYFAQEFRISEDRGGSTGFYDPCVHAIIHYKGRSNFLVSAEWGKHGFDEYSVGLFNMESHEGTYKDAEDGALSKNPIEHGSVDSVLGFTLTLGAGIETAVSYWIAAGENIREVRALDAYRARVGVARIVRETQAHWRAWLSRGDTEGIKALGPELTRLYQESLLVMRAHTDQHGGIIASSDSDMLNYGRDTYGYVWPRDGAIAAHAFDRAGYGELSRNFFTFMARVMEPEGYLMHKYRPDGALGSSWHPWIQHGKPELPIQEDETAIVLFMLWKHLECTHDSACIESLYERMIVPMADFMMQRIDRATKLPMESYDLWEETFGTSTYTSASVYGGLCAAAECAHLLGKRTQEREYMAAARVMRDAICARLFDAEKGTFLKHIRRTETGFEENTTLDVSGLHGLMLFNVLSADDERVVRMVAAVESELKAPTAVGGYIRYMGDRYGRVAEGALSNPWIITTLWMARYYIRKAMTRRELEPAQELLRWAAKHTLPTYLFPEQINPQTGELLSATPLVWSHAEYVIAVHEYLDAYRTLKK